MKVVDARDATGWDMSLHPAGPKWTIRCGNCPATFKARLPIIDQPTVKCPECGVFNLINVVVV